MDDHCHREIVDLHKFFEDWFNGKIATDDDAAGRLDAALGPKFEMVDPDGRIVPREEIVQIVRDARGRDATDGGVRIRIENVRCRPLVDAVWICLYEEWQMRNGTDRGLRSTAILRRAEHAPHGIEWVHLHETWLPTGTETPNP